MINCICNYNPKIYITYTLNKTFKDLVVETMYTKERNVNVEEHMHLQNLYCIVKYYDIYTIKKSNPNQYTLVFTKEGELPPSLFLNSYITIAVSMYTEFL